VRDHNGVEPRLAAVSLKSAKYLFPVAPEFGTKRGKEGSAVEVVSDDAEYSEGLVPRPGESTDFVPTPGSAVAPRGRLPTTS